MELNIFQQVFVNADPKSAELMKPKEKRQMHGRMSQDAAQTMPKQIKAPVKETEEIRRKSLEKENKTPNTLPKNQEIEKPSAQKKSIPVRTSFDASKKATATTKPKTAATTVQKQHKSLGSTDDRVQFVMNNENTENSQIIADLQKKVKQLSIQLCDSVATNHTLQKQNEELNEQKLSLEITVEKLNEAAALSNQRFVDLKNEYEDNAQAREEYWEFRCNEILSQMEELKNSSIC